MLILVSWSQINWTGGADGNLQKLRSPRIFLYIPDRGYKYKLSGFSRQHSSWVCIVGAGWYLRAGLGDSRCGTGLPSGCECHTRGFEAWDLLHIEHRASTVGGGNILGALQDGLQWGTATPSPNITTFFPFQSVFLLWAVLIYIHTHIHKWFPNIVLRILHLCSSGISACIMHAFS